MSKALTMTSNGIVFTGGATTQPVIDRSATFANYVNAATLNFSGFSGMVLVNNSNTGGVALWLMGGGAATHVANTFPANNSPQTGTFAYSGNAAIGYTWTNNSGNTISASFTAIRTRAAA
jgi:hypothetical protein